MVICIVALAVFAILGIGSLRFRKLAKEAFDCTFRTITFRVCKTNLDERIRARLTAQLMKTPPLAKFVYRNFPDQYKLLEKYEDLISQLRILIKKGLSAAIYTQITDIEQEVNGLLTYDREIIKMDKNNIRKLNQTIYKT